MSREINSVEAFFQKIDKMVELSEEIGDIVLVNKKKCIALEREEIYISLFFGINASATSFQIRQGSYEDSKDLYFKSSRYELMRRLEEDIKEDNISILFIPNPELNILSGKYPALLEFLTINKFSMPAGGIRIPTESDISSKETFCLSISESGVLFPSMKAVKTFEITKDSIVTKDDNSSEDNEDFEKMILEATGIYDLVTEPFYHYIDLQDNTLKVSISISKNTYKVLKKNDNLRKLLEKDFCPMHENILYGPGSSEALSASDVIVVDTNGEDKILDVDKDEINGGFLMSVSTYLDVEIGNVNIEKSRVFHSEDSGEYRLEIAYNFDRINMKLLRHSLDGTLYKLD